MIFSITVASLICVIVPCLVGDLIQSDSSYCKRYIMGIFVTFALSQLLFLPLINCQHSFTAYFILYVVLVGGLCIFAIIKNYARYKDEVFAWFSFQKIKENLSLWMVLALLVVGAQVIRVAFGHFFVYADNAMYIPEINDLLETDKVAYIDYITGEPGYKETDIKYLFTTYFPYLASICRLSGVHPSVLVQTILPIVLTIVSYALVWNYGYFLFKDKKASWLFVLFFSVLVETIGGYDNTYANSVLTGIYFGKKVVFTILLPFLLLFIAEQTHLLEDNVVLLSKANILRLLVMMLGICAPSLMGTGLAPMALFSMGIVLSIRKKSALPMLQMAIGMIPAVIMLLMVVYHLYFRV